MAKITPIVAIIIALAGAAWARPSVSTPVPADLGATLGTPPAPQPTPVAPYGTCSVAADKTTITADGVDAVTLTVTVGGKGVSGAVNITDALTGNTVYNVGPPYQFMSGIAGSFVLFVWRSTDIEACPQVNVRAQ